MALIEGGRIPDAAALKSAFRALAKRVHPDAATPDAAPGATPVAAAGAAAATGAPGQVPALDRASRAFIALRSEYEEALAFLEGRLAGGPSAVSPAGTAAAEQAAGAAPAPGNAPAGAAPAPEAERPVAPRPWERRGFYRSFEDLLARGFPRRPPAPYPRRGYDAARAAVAAYLAGRDLTRPRDATLAAFLDLEEGYAALAPWKAGPLSVYNDPARSLYYFLANVVLYHELGFAHLRRIAASFLVPAQEILSSRGELRPLAFMRFLASDLDAGPAISE